MIYNQSAESFLESIRDRCYDGIFLDPPDNLGLKYQGFIDSRDDYIEWLTKIVLECFNHSDVVWVSYNQKHDWELKASLNWYLSKSHWIVQQFIWVYGFGQYNAHGHGSMYRPILRFSRTGVEWNFDAVRVESERMRLGDKRAAGPKIPGDVWEFSRITCGSERRSWHPTQHPEALMERIYLVTPGTSFLDLFGGSGTSLIVCNRLGYDIDIVDISKFYCNEMEKL